MNKWCMHSGVSLNSKKTGFVYFEMSLQSFNASLCVRYDDQTMLESGTVKFLRLITDHVLKFAAQCSSLESKLLSGVFAMVMHVVDIPSCRSFYFAYVSQRFACDTEARSDAWLKTPDVDTTNIYQPLTDDFPQLAHRYRTLNVIQLRTGFAATIGRLLSMQTIRNLPHLLEHQLSITEIRTIKSKKGVSWSCRNCNILSSDINHLKAAILSLRNDLAAREKSAGIDGKAFEELLAELGDRNNRKQNIIMFGVPESDTHDANTRRSRELETVQAVLKALPSGMNTDHIEKPHNAGDSLSSIHSSVGIRILESSLVDQFNAMLHFQSYEKDSSLMNKEAAERQ
ncbi:hypothetical protein Trydic_g4175 [Trypoxylus dichotomus]